MTTTIAQLNPIECIPGVQPDTDATNFSTQHYTFSQNIRFVSGRPQKIGGWTNQAFDMGATINGMIRAIYSSFIGQSLYTMIGTNTKLYALVGSELYDITPVGLAAGQANETAVQGYGMGLYGEGLYGTALLSSSGRSFPRIWFFSSYGDTIIATAGNQTGVYQWAGSTNMPPTLVPNAPTLINYAFVYYNTLWVLGNDNTPNNISGSDINDIEEWTASSSNTVFSDNIEGAGRLLSHAEVNGICLLWTEQETYTMRYVGSPDVLQIKRLEPIGLIAPLARVVVNGNVVWMGLDNFYVYRGGAVEIVQANSQAQSTLLNYVFKNLNFSQKSKCFAWFNKKFNEIWFHYPSANSMEPDRVAVVNVLDFAWTPLEMVRTAAEYPETNLGLPRLATADSAIYLHESGNNDLTDPLPWVLQLNKKTIPVPKNTKLNSSGYALIPDSYQSGDIQVNVKSWLYPQSQTLSFNNDYIITPTTDRQAISVSGKVYQYSFSGNALGQEWRMGNWQDEVQAVGGTS